MQQIVRELDVRLVDLVDQQDRATLCREGVPELAGQDVVGDVVHLVRAELAVTQARDRVVLVEALGGLRRRLTFQVISGRPTDCATSSARTVSPCRAPLHEERTLEGDGGVDGDRQILAGDVGECPSKRWSMCKLAGRRRCSAAASSGAYHRAPRPPDRGEPRPRRRGIPATSVRDRRPGVEGTPDPRRAHCARVGGRHVEGSLNIPLNAQRRIAEVPRDRPLAVVCKSGYRPSAACPRARGHREDLRNVTGGMDAWTRSAPGDGQRRRRRFLQRVSTGRVPTGPSTQRSALPGSSGRESRFSRRSAAQL